MSIPADIAGVGSTTQKLRVSPGFDPLKAKVGPDEYFVLSRIDGIQTLRDVLLATGLPVERAVAIIVRLRSIGALLLPGETSGPVPAAVPPIARPTIARSAASTPAKPMTPPRGIPMATPQRLRPAAPGPEAERRAPSGSVGHFDGPTLAHPAAPHLDLELPSSSASELRALTEDSDLSDGDRRKILAMARLVEAHDPWALLGVPNGSDAQTLKRAYFKLSKEIHPDRYYGRQLGSFAERLPMVFEAVSRAYARLTSPEKASGVHQRVAEQPQTPQEYAVELFERACGLEVGGDALGAMKLFAAAVRIDSQTRYLRRAASCALAAKQPKSALEYAKKAQTQAPDDPSSARLLASAFRAAGKLADAEEVLVMAMALKSENDVLTSELRNDLAEVRRLLVG